MDDLVFLLDVDNTLLDNDRAKEDMAARVEALVGAERAQRWWDLYEQVRRETDVVDYPRTLTRYRATFPDEPCFPHLADYILGLPYAGYVYPGALETLAYLRTLGTTVIVSDGDTVYQAAKIARAGLAAAVDDHVLIFLHKEGRIQEVRERYPAEHYVLVDDKLRILAAVKDAWGERVTTVFPRQGHYAHDPEILASYPSADLSVERIGDVLGHDLPTLLAASPGPTRPSAVPRPAVDVSTLPRSRA
jgi:FMN phosphatase YigB (HAD superfamily)